MRRKTSVSTKALTAGDPRIETVRSSQGIAIRCHDKEKNIEGIMNVGQFDQEVAMNQPFLLSASFKHCHQHLAHFETMFP